MRTNTGLTIENTFFFRNDMVRDTLCFERLRLIWLAGGSEVNETRNIYHTRTHLHAAWVCELEKAQKRVLVPEIKIDISISHRRKTLFCLWYVCVSG